MVLFVQIDEWLESYPMNRIGNMCKRGDRHCQAADTRWAQVCSPSDMIYVQWKKLPSFLYQILELKNGFADINIPA